MSDLPLRVRDIGEFGLIDRLHRVLPTAVTTNERLLVGIGDDAAVLSTSRALVVTTDALVEDIHFRLHPGWTSWKSLGHKALAVNLSDLAAMGATPTLATVTLFLRGDELVADLEAMYAGIGVLAAATGTMIAGGDVVRTQHERAIQITALGEADPRRVLRRSGAQTDDLVGISGTLGAASAGLALLSDPDDSRRSATTAPLLIEALHEPQPRLALGQVLVRRGATAAMDLSDGLFGDLPKILQASDRAAEIDLGRLPVAAAVRALFPDLWLELATRGGEDYELLFTIHPDEWASLIEEASSIGATVTAIGRIVAAGEGPRLWVTEPGGRRTAVAGAWDHFGQPRN